MLLFMETNNTVYVYDFVCFTLCMLVHDSKVVVLFKLDNKCVYNL